ncbi:MAG: PKD domain-containing protein, partial [Candidatus Thermoplasmatota archaeon]|nr:PKD domain-containing protein [Candidatus Thermoplasmatota archaeon]
EIALAASDEDGDALTYSIASGPSHGTLSAIEGNVVTYTPDENYNGEDSFTFKANDGEYDSGVGTVAITVNSVNDAPVASFACSLESPRVRDLVEFTDLSSDPDGPIASWQWDFGDGTESAESNPVHQYTMPGTFAATLTITDSDGATAREEKTITVTPAPPAKVTGLAAEPKNGKVLLSWEAPSDGGSPIIEYNIYAGTQSGALEYIATTANTTYYQDKEPAKGETWYYQVSAANSIGEGERSDELCVVASKPIDGGSSGFASSAGVIAAMLPESTAPFAICAVLLAALAVAGCAIATRRRKK